MFEDQMRKVAHSAIKQDRDYLAERLANIETPARALIKYLDQFDWLHAEDSIGKLLVDNLKKALEPGEHINHGQKLK